MLAHHERGARYHLDRVATRAVAQGSGHRLSGVKSVVPAGDALSTAQALARRIAEKSQVPVKLGKAAFYAQMEMGLDDAYAYASRVMAQNMLARDADEGIGAVLAKRAPVWEDR